MRNTFVRVFPSLYLKKEGGQISRNSYQWGKQWLKSASQSLLFTVLLSDCNGMKLEINIRKRNEKKLIPWRLNNMILKKQWVNDEKKEEIKKYLERNDNEHRNRKNLWDASKAVLRGKFIVIQAFLK